MSGNMERIEITVTLQDDEEFDEHRIGEKLIVAGKQLIYGGVNISAKRDEKLFKELKESGRFFIVIKS